MSKKVLVVLLALVLVTLSLSVVSVQDSSVPRGGTVVVSDGWTNAFTKNFNPFAPQVTPFVQSGMFEPLMVFNPPKGDEATPWLATGYAYADDLKSITFTLRDGVQWSDGEPFGADDVVFTFNMFKQFPAIDRGAVWTFLDSVEKVDALTVKFTLSKVFTLAHIQIGETQIIPEHQWSTVTDPTTYANDTPVGTGPFTEVGANYSDEVLELCRNPHYWGKDAAGNQLPYIDCIREPRFTGNDPANLAAANGELDWIGNFIPDIENVYVSKNADHNHYFFWPGGGTVQFYMNTTKAPFNDVKFRTALDQAIDLDTIANVGQYGYTVPSNAVGLGPRYQAWISQDALDAAASMGLNTYDVEAAKATLDAAGYVDKDGDGWRDMPDGTAITFKVQVVNGWTDWMADVNTMSQNFQDIGLNASVDTPEFGAWLNNLQSANYDTSIGWSTAQASVWNFYHDLFYSPLIDAASNTANATTWGRWTSDATDGLIDQFTSTTDQAVQTDVINQLQMAYVQNVAVVPLFPGPTWYEWNDSHITGFPSQDDYYTQGSPWEQQSGARLLVLTSIHCVDATSCGQ